MTRQRPIDDKLCVADSEGLNHPYGRGPVQAIMRHGLRVTFFQRRTYTSPDGPTTLGPPHGGGGFRVTRAKLLDMARGSDVVFVCLPSNVGYAAGANRRIERALELLPEAVLVMNNDVEAETGAAKKLVARRVADASVGEAFLARADVIRACRGFDERYVSYFDDVDLSVRAHRAGWRLEVVPGAVFRHAVGASGAPIRGVVFRARNHTLFLHSALGRGRVRSALLGGYAAGEQVLRVAVRRRPTAAAVWAAGSLRLPSDRA